MFDDVLALRSDLHCVFLLSYGRLGVLVEANNVRRLLHQWSLLLHLPSEVMLRYWSVLSTCHQKWCRAIDLCFYIWHQRMLRATVWIFASTFDIRSDATLWIFASTFAIIGDAMRLIFASTFASRSDAMLLILLLHLPPEVMLRYWSTRHDSQKQVAISTLFHNLPLNVMFFGWKQFSEMRKRALPTLMRICSTRHLTAPFPLKVSWFTYWKL